MGNDSIENLVSLFDSWRKKKRHVSERTPEILLERARQVAKIHGINRVVLALGIDRKLICNKRAGKKFSMCGPGYSRIELQAPASAVLEAEAPSGLKLRVFSITPEVVRLMSLLGGLVVTA